MMDDGESKLIKSPHISQKEEKTLNQIVDLLLKGKRIRNIASCMIPKMDYVLNVRLQDAINRGFSQTASVLQRHIQSLNEISQMRVYFQQNNTLENDDREAHSEEQTRQFTNQILTEMMKMTVDEQKEYLLNQQKTFDEMQEFYQRRKRAIDREFNTKRSNLLIRFETEKRSLKNKFSHQMKHFHFSNIVEDKQTLISILKQRNKHLTEQTLSAPHKKLSRKDNKESDLVSEETIQRHERELEKLKKKEKQQHTTKMQTLYMQSLDKLIEKQKEISKRMIQNYEYRTNEIEKSRKRDISEILLKITIIKRNIGRVSSPAKYIFTSVQNDSEEQEFKSPVSLKLTPVTMLSSSEIIEFDDDDDESYVPKQRNKSKFDDQEKDDIPTRQSVTTQTKSTNEPKNSFSSRRRSASVTRSKRKVSFSTNTNMESRNSSRPSYAPVSQASYAYDDPLYPYENEESELEVTTTLSDLMKHKFY